MTAACMHKAVILHAKRNHNAGNHRNIIKKTPSDCSDGVFYRRLFQRFSSAVCVPAPERLAEQFDIQFTGIRIADLHHHRSIPFLHHRLRQI